MKRLSQCALVLVLCSCGHNPEESRPWPDGARYYVGWPTCPDTSLAFSPGGDVLLFCSSASGNPGIYGFDGVGSPSLRTFSSYDEFTGPTGCWCDMTAQDSLGKIIYAAVRDDGTGEIRWISGNSYNVHMILYDSLPNMDPTWSPLADSIVFCSKTDGAWGLWHGAVASTVVPEPLYCPSGDCVRPSYSPDGQWILFQHRDSEASDWDIWMVRPDGTDAHAVIEGSSQDIQPTWAPAGHSGWFAFSSDRTGNFEIWVSDMQGDSLLQVTDDPADDIYPAWSPGGDMWIAFSADRASDPGEFDIFWLPDPL